MFCLFLVKLENLSYKEHKVNKINRYYCGLNSESNTNFDNTN